MCWKGGEADSRDDETRRRSLKRGWVVTSTNEDDETRVSRKGGEADSRGWRLGGHNGKAGKLIREADKVAIITDRKNKVSVRKTLF